MSLKVKAVDGRLVPKIGAPGRQFYGYRECNRQPDGTYHPDEQVHHTIAGAPGVRWGQNGYEGQTSDLFLAGREVKLTRFAENGAEIVETVEDDAFIRTMIREGGLEQVKEPANAD
jgi:hypothetical protein